MCRWSRREAQTLSGRCPKRCSGLPAGAAASTVLLVSFRTASAMRPFLSLGDHMVTTADQTPGNTILHEIRRISELGNCGTHAETVDNSDAMNGIHEVSGSIPLGSTKIS